MIISFIIPFYKKMKEFKLIFPQNYDVYAKFAKEIIICLDEPYSRNELIEFIKKYRLPIKVFINRKEHDWRNPAAVINVGIYNSQADLCFVSSPESLLDKDLIPMALEVKNNDSKNVIIGKLKQCIIDSSEPVKDTRIHYGSILFSREEAALIGGYDECYSKWGGDDDNFRVRLKLNGCKIIPINNGVTHFGQKYNSDNTRRCTKDELRRIFNPGSARCSRCFENWGHDFNELIYNSV